MSATTRVSLEKTIDFYGFIALTSSSIAQAHSSVERAGLLGGVKFRPVPADENNELRGSILEKYIREDLAKGLIPFYVRKLS